MSGWVQTTLYGIFIRAGDPKPQPGSPQWIRHRRIIQASVILLYLLYTIYEADWQLQRDGTFYKDLGVRPDITTARLKSTARRLAAQFHPDKVNDNPLAEATFIHLRRASDTLIEPTKRFAYDRFGPTMLEWKHCVTIRDYVQTGAYQIVPYYLVSAAFLSLLSFFGYLESGKYWRFLAMASLLVFEGFVVSRPQWPTLLTKIVNPVITVTGRPPYLPFQAVVLARKLSITLFIALSQITPLLKGLQHSSNNAVRQTHQLDRLDALAKHNDQEAGRLLGLELTPFAVDEAAGQEVRERLKQWIVQNTVRSVPQVRDAVGRALQRRRVDAPAGARGTR